MARAPGERLIDASAITEVARRLMGLQRERLVESRLIDQQTRRMLHDEVLPELHSVLLGLSRRNRPGTGGRAERGASANCRAAGGAARRSRPGVGPAGAGGGAAAGGRGRIGRDV